MEDGGVRARIARALNKFVAKDAAARAELNGKVHFAKGIGPRRAIPLFIEGRADEGDAPLLFAGGELFGAAGLVALIQEALDFRIGKGLLAGLAIGLAFGGLLVALDDLALLAHFLEAFLAGFLFFLLDFRGRFLRLLNFLDDIRWRLHDRVDFRVVNRFGRRRLGGLRLGWRRRRRRLGRGRLEGRWFVFVAVEVFLDDDGEVDWDDRFVWLAGRDGEEVSKDEKRKVDDERKDE